MTSSPKRKVLVATGCDANHYELAEGLIASLDAVADRKFDIGFIQLDKHPAPASILAAIDHHRTLIPHHPGDWGGKGFLLAAMGLKARLPDLFPGYDTYVWMDGDTWLQEADAIDEIVAQAALADVCINPQLDRAYFSCRYPDSYTIKVYNSIFGRDVADKMSHRPMFNAGVFAARGSSEIWNKWRNILDDIKKNMSNREDRFFSDQIPLHFLIHTGKIRPYPMRSVNNWLALHAPPRIHAKTGRLMTPFWPHERIRILHLVGSSKTMTLDVQGTAYPITYAGACAIADRVRAGLDAEAIPAPAPPASHTVRPG